MTRGRFGSELGKIIGPRELPILPASCPLARSIMISAHNEAHKGQSDTCFQSRTKAWILQGRRLAEQVSRECPRCPILWKKHLGQQLGNLPPERLHFEEKPWTAVFLDLFGPYSVKTVAGRSRVKVWPLVIGCFSTGATHIELCVNYGSDAFLQAFTNFATVRGYPAQVYTDKGSQLARASQNVAENPVNWDWKHIQAATAQMKTTWRFCPSASQWWNGMAESRVKAFKQALDNLMPAGVENMNHAEFFTLLKLCCNLVNERPLGVRKVSDRIDSDILSITPNMLLLGRSSTQPPDDYVSPEDENKLTRRIKFIQEAENQWWRMWYCQVWRKETI